MMRKLPWFGGPNSGVYRGAFGGNGDNLAHKWAFGESGSCDSGTQSYCSGSPAPLPSECECYQPVAADLNNFATQPPCINIIDGPAL